MNEARRIQGLVAIEKAEIKLLGQMSLMVNEQVAMLLALAATGDLDALLTMETEVKQALRSLLQTYGLIYDEDSHLIWIPPGSSFDTLFDFTHLVVRAIDPESALVSKAVEAPRKNKQLIREALATGQFPSLGDRIEASGGKLRNFF